MSKTYILDMKILARMCPEIMPYIFAPEGEILLIKPISSMKTIYAIANRFIELDKAGR